MSAVRRVPAWGVLLGVLCLVMALAGCQLTVQRHHGVTVTLTEQVPRTALIVVVPPGMDGRAVAQVAGATANPGEDIDVLQSAGHGQVLVASRSPAPAVVVVPGRPPAPGTDPTAYQLAKYRQELRRWQGQVAAGRRAVTSRTGLLLSRWAAALDIPAKVSAGTTTGATTDHGGLLAECATAANAVSGLSEVPGSGFGSRRVVLLYADTLGGTPPPGQLTGDDVIVVIPFLPSVPAASMATAHLTEAGAAQALVVGPETPANQVARLVDAGFSGNVTVDSFSGPALFANDSAVLRPGAVRVLSPLLAALLRPGTTAVINGYASTTGSAAVNDRLSYARAASVAGFYEAHGVPPYSLVIAGHGAADPVAAGPSAANRRVTVQITDP
jgi:outer membrane protein OmpA-like peptidoglycan-associated protein